MQKQEEKEAGERSEYSGPLVIGLTIRDDAEYQKV